MENAINMRNLKTKTFEQAPEFHIQKWLNTQDALSLEKLKGKVVAAYAFQMLCPGCVEYSIPQARQIHSLFSPNDVAVLGLHTVFEHHNAMGEESLRAFIHEYQIDFPVGIDMPSSSDRDPIPKTMRTYNMGGTPTLLLIDRQGHLRKQAMGHITDMLVGAELMALIKEENSIPGTTENLLHEKTICTPEGCI